MSLGPLEILVVLILVMLLFGAGRFPAAMENLAKGINSFKQGLREGDEPTQKKLAKDTERKKEE